MHYFSENPTVHEVTKCECGIKYTIKSLIVMDVGDRPFSGGI